MRLAGCEDIGGDPPVAHLKELTRYMRNAIAHFNIQFTADENPPHEITGVSLWNSNRNGDFWREVAHQSCAPDRYRPLSTYCGDIDCATPSTDRSR